MAARCIEIVRCALRQACHDAGIFDGIGIYEDKYSY